MADVIINPTTPVTNGSIVTSTNPLPVKVVSGGSSSITINTTTITGGTTTRLLYDNGGTVGETAAVTYASASITLALSSLAVLGIMSSASAVDTGISRIGAASLAIGNGTAADTSGAITLTTLNLQNSVALTGGTGLFSGGTLTTTSNVLTGTIVGLGATNAITFLFETGVQNKVLGNSGTIIGWSSSTGGTTDASTFRGNADTGLSRVSASVVAVGNGSAADFSGTLKLTSLIYGSAAVAVGAPTGTGLLVLNNGPTFSSASTVTFTAGGTITYGGVTWASTVTGTGSNTLATNPTLSSVVFSSSATTTFTAGGTITYGGVTWASTVTGTGSNVLATNPSVSSLVATGTLTYGGVTLSSAVTGTGSMVLSAAPSITGNMTFVSASATGILTTQNGVAASATGANFALQYSSTASFGVIWGALGSVAPTIAATQGCLYINTTGSSTAQRMYIKVSAAGTWTSFTTAA